jgi:hypothetical protein
VNGQVVQQINPSYNLKNIDRWNNYKPSGSCNGDVISDPLQASEFPYTSLNELEAQNSAIAWN